VVDVPSSPGIIVISSDEEEEDPEEEGDQEEAERESTMFQGRKMMIPPTPITTLRWVVRHDFPPLGPG